MSIEAITCIKANIDSLTPTDAMLLLAAIEDLELTLKPYRVKGSPMVGGLDTLRVGLEELRALLAEHGFVGSTS